MKAAGIIILLLMLSLSSAVLIESAGMSGFANDTVTAKCLEPDVKEIYLCSGDVVKTVSAVPGTGSTFLRPDGKNITCPDVAPSQMGAECMQLMVPNYCQLQMDCREFAAPMKPEENTTVVNDTAPSPVDDANKASSKPAAEPAKKSESGPPGVLKYNGEGESLLSYLAAFIAVLGIAAVGILFVLFRKSLAEEEA
ncbi:hypothetical protein H0O00_04385 [Candidatus Micrarchaeota archaeon]|nr:hypothetical protein [Candidatus Micrarchaeota archaeon]